LVRSIVRQQVWATALTLGAIMLVLLIIADVMNLQVRGLALVRQLRSIESVDISSDAEIETRSRAGRQQVGFILVDDSGHWTAGEGERGEKPRGRAGARWPEAATVLTKGELQGRGQLPWLSEPVVWAARMMYDPDGQRVILVVWHPVSAIRASATRTSYGFVILGTVLMAAVGVGLSLRSSRRITRLLDSIADSSTRMAAGDYRVHLPAQPVAELDRVSDAINRLAQDLTTTAADLQAEHERLVRLEQLQRQFVADASHELRAPLTSMRVTLEAWQDGVLHPEEQPAALAQLLHECEHLSGLISKLLDLSRIESGREAVTLTAVEVPAVVEEVVATCRDLPGAAIALAFPADLPRAQADREAVRRVLQNMVENARRFTSTTGSIRIWGEVRGGRLCLGVTDTGCGIAPEYLPRIWDRFARAPQARGEGKAGSGLGLAIVKALVEAMGGEVGLDSTLGSGTTVWMLLDQATG
jgi:signal transduction histidine kinase